MNNYEVIEMNKEKWLMTNFYRVMGQRSRTIYHVWAKVEKPGYNREKLIYNALSDIWEDKKVNYDELSKKIPEEMVQELKRTKAGEVDKNLD